MESVSGIGGVFFKCDDPEATKAWYEKNLGVTVRRFGDEGSAHVFAWRPINDPTAQAYTVWNPFKSTTKYFDPSTSDFMINYRVTNLDAMIAQLNKFGIPILGRQSWFNGQFAWIVDLDGRKIELWEPAEGH